MHWITRSEGINEGSGKGSSDSKWRVFIYLLPADLWPGSSWKMAVKL